METHAFPLEAQPLGSAYDLTWGWDTSTTPGAEASRSASGGALLESQLMPLAMTSEQPCVVNLNVWDFDHRRPSAILDKPRISVPRAVLCSEMGTQFSPCGRFLALCVAVDSLSDAGRRWQQDHVRRCMQRMRTAEGVRDAALSRYATGAAGPASGSGNGAGPSSAHAAPGVDVCTSADGAAAPDAAGPSCGVAAGAGQLDAPLQVVDTGDGFMLPVAQAWEVFPHDVQWLEFPAGTPQSEVDAAVQSAREAARLNKPLYELRVYSLDGATFGKVLCARLIRAAHCLTSVQFSPTSEHLLVAYGRRYISLCNLVAEGRGLVPAHTIVELHRTRDLEVVRMLPSLEDEVNVAAFHPVPGAGIVYGTKEGRLRSLRYDRRTPRRPAIPLAAVGERMDDELAAAEAGDARDGSDDEGDASGAHTGQR
uniref:Uncharacterized protein n=1 Tax=Chlamydomonas euryale TaxID=1486919 RepID=A0A7R9W073_9CHLO